MTMTRTEKMSHEMELNIARKTGGYVAEEWAAPKNRRRAMAENGHLRMPLADYIRERMHRKPSTRSRRDVAVERMRARRGL